MPSYKLTYFNGRGRAEVVRLLFAQAGVQYEDVRVEFKDWPDLKPKTPLGSLPILEVDGKVTIAETLAIARLVARETGQYGSNAVEAAVIDWVTYAIHDFFEARVTFHFAKTDAEKEVAKAKLDKLYPSTTEKLEAFLIANKGGDGFLVGDKPTLADIAFYNFMQGGLVQDPKMLDNTPKLKALFNRVTELPNIKAWIDKRPETDF